MGKWGAPHGQATDLPRARRVLGGDVARSLEAAVEGARGPLDGWREQQREGIIAITDRSQARTAGTNEAPPHVEQEEATSIDTLHAEQNALAEPCTKIPPSTCPSTVLSVSRCG